MKLEVLLIGVIVGFVVMGSMVHIDQTIFAYFLVALGGVGCLVWSSKKFFNAK